MITWDDSKCDKIGTFYNSYYNVEKWYNIPLKDNTTEFYIKTAKCSTRPGSCVENQIKNLIDSEKKSWSKKYLLNSFDDFDLLYNSHKDFNTLGKSL